MSTKMGRISCILWFLNDISPKKSQCSGRFFELKTKITIVMISVGFNKAVGKLVPMVNGPSIDMQCYNRNIINGNDLGTGDMNCIRGKLFMGITLS